MIPGANLLNMARRLIAFQSPAWSQWTGETKAHGIVTPTYAAAVPIDASVQAVSQSMYEQLGLDLQKSYISVFTDVLLRDLERNGSCDMLDYGGRRYNVQSNTSWQNQDGWQQSICIDIGPTP